MIHILFKNLLFLVTATLVTLAWTGQKHIVAEESAPWAYDRYKVLVWFAHDGSPELQVMMDQLQSNLVSQTRIVDSSTWKVEARYAPAPWDRRIKTQIESFTGGQLCDDDEIKKWDKLIMVRIRQQDYAYEVTAREIDIYTRQWGATQSNIAYHRERLDWAIYKSVARAFMPLCRINQVFHDKKKADVHVRGVELTKLIEFDEDGNAIEKINKESPAWVKPEDVLQPIVRRADRLQRVTDKSVNPVEFTYLIIDQHFGTKLDCYIHEYKRASLAGRQGFLIKKMALVIRPPRKPTRIKLISKTEKKPLAGYQVFAKNLLDPEKQPELVGYTDWRGIIDIEPDELNIRVLTIKNGTRGLARLPVIPGLYAERSAAMPDDEARLYAEGVIHGLESELLDTVAKRQVYMAQLKKSINDGDVDKSEELYAKIDALPDATNFSSKLAFEEEELRKMAKSPREVEKISEMFVKVREESDLRLSSKKVQEMLRYVEDLKQGKSVVIPDDPVEGEEDKTE